MKWGWLRMPRWSHQHVGTASPEASAALHQAYRSLDDAKAMRQEAQLRVTKADEVASALEETRRQNHFGAAVAESMRKMRGV